jgi:hypothetical protein
LSHEGCWINPKLGKLVPIPLNGDPNSTVPDPRYSCPPNPADHCTNAGGVWDVCAAPTQIHPGYAHNLNLKTVEGVMCRAFNVSGTPLYGNIYHCVSHSYCAKLYHGISAPLQSQCNQCIYVGLPGVDPSQGFLWNKNLKCCHVGTKKPAPGKDTPSCPYPY